MKKVMYAVAVAVVISTVTVMMLVPGCSSATNNESTDSTVVDSAALVDSTALTGDSTTAKIDTTVSAN
jgi:hypothetical protein